MIAAIGSIFIETKMPTRSELLSLFITVFGVAIAMWEGSDSKASATGIIVCVLGERQHGPVCWPPQCLQCQSKVPR